MSKVDQEFQKLCRTILEEGRGYENKNRGVKRLQIPSYTFRHSFSDGFPAITNKKLYWKGIVGELIWFLRGDNDVEYLNQNGIKIWNKDAWNWHRKHGGQESFEAFEKLGVGSVGQNYSVQWRNFNGYTDQILELLKGMSKDIMSSRLKVNAWNPSETEETALPPCHSEFQIIGVPLTNKERRIIAKYGEDEWAEIVDQDLALEALETIPEVGFELHWNQRSVDTFLGLPFNIASYGLLAKVLEAITGYPALAIEGTLKCVHFYDNQYEAAKELLKRDAYGHPNCELKVDGYLSETNLVGYEWDNCIDIDEVFNSLNIQDFNLVGYSSDDGIKVEMLAPKE